MMHDPATILIAIISGTSLLTLIACCIWAARNPPVSDVYHLSASQIVGDE